MKDLSHNTEAELSNNRTFRWQTVADSGLLEGDVVSLGQAVTDVSKHCSAFTVKNHGVQKTLHLIKSAIKPIGNSNIATVVLKFIITRKCKTCEWTQDYIHDANIVKRYSFP
jgi:hypothetical protein